MHSFQRKMSILVDLRLSSADVQKCVLHRRVPCRTILFFCCIIDRLDFWTRRRWIVVLRKRLKLVDGSASMLRLSVRPSPTDLHIDKRWDGMVSALVLRVLQIETELWRLSTLGGAASAMGFFSPQFTQYAFMISVKQLRLAFLVGDPVLVSRCFLYISLAFAQKGCYRTALKILRQEWVRGKELGSAFLLNCARGVWSTIKWRMKNRKVVQRITN